MVVLILAQLRTARKPHANVSVRIVSCWQAALEDTLAMNIILALPPSDSLSRCVSLESR